MICPETTEDRKTFGQKELIELIKQMGAKYKNISITLALSSKKSPFFIKGHHYHFFQKNRKASERFLTLINKQDLIISVDSGPLHLAHALGKPAIAFFSCTAPEKILNDFSTTTPIRTSKLSQIQCENKTCTDAVRLKDLFCDDIFSHIYKPVKKALTYTTTGCPYTEGVLNSWEEAL